MAPPGGYFHTEMWGGVFRTRNWVVIAFGAVAVLLGLWGFSTCHAADCQTQGFGEKLFRTVDLIRLSSHYTPDHDPWPLVLAQLMMPLALVAGAIRLFVLNMRRDLKVVMVRRMRGHVIVCGLGETGRHIAEQLADAGHRVVAISHDNQDVNALACERRGIVVLRGDGMDVALLKVAGIRRAASVFISCGSDATNIEVGLRADSIPRPDAPPLAIWVELRSEWLYSQILAHRGRITVNGAAEFRLFNLNANAARLLMRSPGFRRAATAAVTAGRPHLVAVGQGQTLMEIVIQAVQGPFALPGCRLAISLISKDGQALHRALLARYPGLETCADVTVLDCDFAGDLPWPQVATCFQDGAPCAVVADLEDEIATMKVAIQLRHMLDGAAMATVPVFARIWQQNCLGGFLGQIEGDGALSDRLTMFGDLQSLTSAELLLEQSIDMLANAAHEAYRASTKGAAPPWSALSERDKQSNRAFADHIAVKLAHAGLAEGSALTGEQVETLAQMEHWRWSQALRLRGWTLGPRDEFRKNHPLLVAWEDLAEDSRETNRAMIRRIPAIFRAAPAAKLAASLQAP